MKLKIKRGLWIVFAFNLMVGAVVWWAGSNVLNATFTSPIVTDFIDSVPTITIEDKTVVDPVDLNTSRSLGGMPLLYIQTDRDFVGVGAIQDGIYITRKAISFLNNGIVQQAFEFPEKGQINSELIQNYFHRIAIWAPAVLGLFYVLRLWIFYLLLVGFTALIALIPAVRRRLTACVVWRCAMWAHVGVLGTDFVCSYLGYPLPVLTYYNMNLSIWTNLIALFFITMLLQLIVAWVVSVIIMLFSAKRSQKKVSKKKD